MSRRSVLKLLPTGLSPRRRRAAELLIELSIASRTSSSVYLGIHLTPRTLVRRSDGKVLHTQGHRSAGEPGFEPGLRGSKPRVLPLHHSPESWRWLSKEANSEAVATRRRPA